MEPLCERIVEALRTRLEGTTGFYRPDAVIRYPAWDSSCVTAMETVYTMSPDDEDHVENTYTGTLATMRLDLTVTHKFNPANETNPFRPPADDRWKVQNRLRDDARKRLRGDLKAGDTALTVRIPYIQMGAEETYFKGLAVVFMRLEVDYAFEDAA